MYKYDPYMCTYLLTCIVMYKDTVVCVNTICKQEVYPSN